MQDETKTNGGASVPATTTDMPAAPPGHRWVNPLDHYLANEPGGSGFLVDGEFLNLNGQGGEWLIGREKRPIGATTPFLVHVEGMAIGHVKLVDGKIAEREIGLVAEGYQRKEREELDDFKEHTWPLNRRGEREDPWKKTTYLPMRSMEDDEPVVFGPIAPTQLNAIKQFVAVVRRTELIAAASVRWCCCRRGASRTRAAARPTCRISRSSVGNFGSRTRRQSRCNRSPCRSRRRANRQRPN